MSKLVGEENPGYASLHITSNTSNAANVVVSLRNPEPQQPLDESDGYLEPVSVSRPEEYLEVLAAPNPGGSQEAQATPEYAEAYDHMPGRKGEPVYHERVSENVEIQIGL